MRSSEFGGWTILTLATGFAIGYIPSYESKWSWLFGGVILGLWLYRFWKITGRYRNRPWP